MTLPALVLAGDVAVDHTKNASGGGDLFLVIGLVLTIAALGLAIAQVGQSRKQSRDLTKQSDDLKGHEESLKKIADSLSTHYVGTFPEYLTNVVDVINSAKEELLIVSGNPTPAYYSDPLLWNDYRHAIVACLHRNVRVKVVSMSAERRIMRVHDEFGHAESVWDAYMKENRRILSRFVEGTFPEEDVDSLTYDRFVELLVASQEENVSTVFGLATRVEIDSTIVLQAWIADTSEAVFSIETLADQELSHGLYTSDQRFVSALRSMVQLFR